MEETQWLKQIQASQSEIRAVSYSLERLAQAFTETGNRKVSITLLDLANRLDGASSAIDAAVGDKIMQDLGNTEIVSQRMLNGIVKTMETLSQK